MCGIVGIIHRGKSSDIGSEMTKMLQSLKHRGPDSTGFALYGSNGGGGKSEFVLRYKVAEQEELAKGFAIHQLVKDRRATVTDRLKEMGASIVSEVNPTEYSVRTVISFKGDLNRLIDYLEDVDNVEVLSIGNSLELVKDLGDAQTVSAQYKLGGFVGTHAIGHTRMATESSVDIRSAHPYWAYPYSDVSVVHNGQLTNYWSKRREMERKGRRFLSNCDSELVAVYIADRLESGESLEDAMRRSVDELDGVFSYVVATRNQLGMAKDTMAAKPMVVYESADFVGLASEEIAIRSCFPQEIDTYDPYDGEVMAWQI